MSKNSDTLVSFLAGMAAGAVLGILFAPDSGKHTRDKLSFQLEKYRDKLKEMLDEMLHQQGNFNSPAREEGEKVVDEAKGKAEQLLSDVEALIEEIRNRKAHV